ncbi:MAG: GtrA family protein [Corynebacterium kroppenstedtii]|nr:GtrA family protein [Corynebacterium kroppenstedtii]
MSETKPDHPTDDHAEPELLTPNLSGALAAESAAMDDVDAATESGATATDASASADTATPGTAGVDAPAPQGASVLTHLYKFVIAGGISAVVDYGLTMIIQHAFGQSYPLAKAIGFIFGTITAYIINRRWTFEAEPSAKKFLQTMSLYALMFAVQWGLAVSVNHLLLNAGASAFIAGTVG